MACKEASRGAIAEEGVVAANPGEASSDADLKVRSVDFKVLESMLHQDNGKTYVVNFWATWCAPCVKELPHFEKLNEQYAHQNVEVILVSLDFPKMLESQLIPFVKKRNLRSEVIHLNDPKQNTWIPKVSQDWSGAIPATVIYKDGQRKFYERSFTYNELENELKPFLQ